MTSDVLDFIWALFGTSVHYVLETSAKQKGCMVEVTLFTTINVDGEEIRISCTIDLIEQPAVYDYKVTSAWAVMKDGGLAVKPDWKAQLNINYYIARMNGFAELDRAFVVTILRDWSYMNMVKNKDYPREQVVKLPVPLLRMELLEAFVKTRVQQHRQAEGLSDDELPECTPEERWEKPSCWAVYKSPQAKRAYKLCDTEAQADSVYESLGGDVTSAYIELRQGESPRCDRYCAGAPWCNQWAKMKGSMKTVIKQGGNP